jgi:tryptophanyl-tRNA synthetase
VEGLKGRAEAENLVNIYAGLADETSERVIAEYKGAQFSKFKEALADIAVTKLTPLASEMRRLLGDRAEIDRILKSGAERAHAMAAPTMADVRRLVGFVA